MKILRFEVQFSKLQKHTVRILKRENKGSISYIVQVFCESKIRKHWFTIIYNIHKTTISIPKIINSKILTHKPIANYIKNNIFI